MGLVATLDRLWYPDHRDHWDARAFRTRILDRLTPDMCLLDIGAGRGNEAEMDFKGRAAQVIGADVDPVVLENPLVDRAVIITDKGLEGIEDGSVDLIVSCNVWEHVAAPKPFLDEAHRVLKSGGAMMAKTPNFWHYMPIIAHLTPTWFHKLYNRLRGRDAVDTFPTTYKLNTRADIARHAAASGFTVEMIEAEEGRPEYLRLTALTYLFGWLYERMVNALGWKGAMLVYYITLRKPG